MSRLTSASGFFVVSLMSFPLEIRRRLVEEGLLPVKIVPEGSHPFLHGFPTIEGEGLAQIADWVRLREASGDEAVAAWLEFLHSMAESFEEVGKSLGSWNTSSSHSLGHDKWSVGWAGLKFLPLANALYVLGDYAVDGRVLECGVFKGSSTVCLSRVCEQLNRALDCADSFEGLPKSEGHYGSGDFLGTLDEVKKNVENFGCPDRVNYIKGWYSETLSDYRSLLSLLWIDVDLQDSTLDVLRAVGERLNPAGIIFSDGFSKGVDIDGDRVVHTGGEPAGFARWFAESGRDYTVAFASDNGLVSLALRDDPAMRFIVPPGFVRELIN